MIPSQVQIDYELGEKRKRSGGKEWGASKGERLREVFGVHKENSGTLKTDPKGKRARVDSPWGRLFTRVSDMVLCMY